MTNEELIQTLIANIDECLSTNADVMKVDVEYLPIIKDALKKQDSVEHLIGKHIVEGLDSWETLKEIIVIICGE